MGQIKSKEPDEFDIRPDETYSDWKRRKSEEKNLPKSMSEKNSSKRSIGLCENTNEKKNLCKCRKCINRRNRSKGRRKQNQARKLLKIPSNRFAGADAHEENWLGGLRVEVKSGKQVQPLANVFYKGKRQSDFNHIAIGSEKKPFAHVSMPDGTTGGIISLEIKDLENFCVAVLENFGYEIDNV